MHLSALPAASAGPGAPKGTAGVIQISAGSDLEQLRLPLKLSILRVAHETKLSLPTKLFSELDDLSTLPLKLM